MFLVFTPDISWTMCARQQAAIEEKYIMHSKLSKTALVGLLAIVFIAAALSKIYFVRDHSGGSIMSKGDEAYLFLGSGHTGYNFSYLEYPLIRVKEYFYAPPFPEDRNASIIVMRITPSGTERYSINFGKDAGGTPQLLTPFENDFYAMCRGAALCKWTHSGFQPATEEEQRRFGGIDHLVRGAMNNETINGWSVHQIGRSRGEHLELSIGGKFVISAKNEAALEQESPRVSIDLIRPGIAPENLYHADGAPRRVSKAEYKRDFPGGSLKE
ncbi:MAG: hypothetical protein LAP21_23575 [Acidobacteriia bacterium]|nr:hypothetical protein [Terriglobia bacterium]